MFWKKILYYLDFRTFFSGRKESNTNLKMMHGINRISLIMFIFCIIVMLIKFWPF
ncbi:MAG: DUF6728 family protein [Flavobacteriales bacterium]